MVAVIDYDAGNIKSVVKAVEYLKKECVVTRDIDIIMKADHIILPGVGAFGDAMEKLVSFGLDETIREITDRKIPFIGICLGLQLLFEESEESPGVKGLGLFKGRIRKFPENKGLKVPNIGWNSLEVIREGRLLKGLAEDSFMYFVHSYYADAEDKNIVSARIDYGVKADVVVEKDNVFACQFHPEKSSSQGLKLLENFLDL